MKQISADNFYSDVINSPIPVLVEFSAEWCGACKALLPVLEEVEIDYLGKVKFYTMNAEENEELARSFGVQNLPSVLLYQNGEVLNGFTGLKNARKVDEFLTINLGRYLHPF